MTIKTKLYNGEVELVFDSFRHSYTVTDEASGRYDEKLPSATTALSIIAKPQLIYWAANMTADSIKAQLEPGKSYDELQIDAIIESGRKAHDNKKKQAGSMGTLVHEWVEDYIKGGNPAMPVNEQLSMAIKKFVSWVEFHNVKFLKSEQQIYSRKYDYTGTLDFICVVDGLMYIGDLKTSSGIYPEYLIQTAAYRFARTEEFPEEKYFGQIIVRVGKDDGLLEIGLLNDDDHKGWYKKMFGTFVYALELYKGMEKVKDFKIKKIREVTKILST